MNGKFAKLFDMPDGNQVLVQKLYDPENEKDILVISTSLEDSHFEAKLGYNNTNSRDEMFDTFDNAMSEAWLADVVAKMH